MRYDQFEQVLGVELPLNRKERFFTGTVLPALLFADGLQVFYRFLQAIPGFPSTHHEQMTGEDFLFYTEYNLKESAGSRCAGRSIHTDTKDTPDIVIELLRPSRLFVVIEAKMFSSIGQGDLDSQMAAQRKAVVDVLVQTFGLPADAMLHVALLPARLRLGKTDLYQVLNWELFTHNASEAICGNRFYNYLRYALEHYDQLVQNTGWHTASTVQTTLPGQQIYEDGKKAGTLWVGRQGGEQAIISDMQKGWRSKQYCVNTDRPVNGRSGNWLTSRRFAEIVDQYGR